MKRTTPALFALVFAGVCLQPALAADPVVTIDCANLHLPRMVFSYTGPAGPSDFPSGSGTRTWSRLANINSLVCN